MAQYAEGKLAQEMQAEKWKHSGGIDGEIFDYYSSGASAPADGSPGGDG